MGFLDYLLKSEAINAAKNIALSAINTAGNAAENNAFLGSPKSGVIRIPHSSSDYVGKNYLDVEKELMAYGFTKLYAFQLEI